MEKELRILMLEDVEEDAGLVDRVLRLEKISFVRLRVDTREEFTQALESFNPDLILSDHSLPAFNSVEALNICKEKKINLPFILVTGAVSEEFAVSCLKRGADDYVLKGNLSRLPMAIRYALRHRDQENMRREQETKLIRQNEELIKINRELDSFVYSVSHHLRSPLSSVMGLVHVALQDEQKNEEMNASYLKMIGRSVSGLDDTLKEILNYSRNSRTQSAIAPIDLQKMIRQSFAEIKYLGRVGEIDIQIDVTSTVPLYSDDYRLSVILANLISNALRFSDDSKNNSFIKVFAVTTADSATITIRDNGIGIADECLPHIFNMFYRGSEKSEGAGLGLYIAKEMIETLGARISVSSQLNEYSEFTLTVPNRVQVQQSA